MKLSEYPVAILAGGLATRLRPITEKIPKVLVPVANKPFLAHQLELLRKEGVARAVLCLQCRSAHFRPPIPGRPRRPTTTIWTSPTS